MGSMMRFGALRSDCGKYGEYWRVGEFMTFATALNQTSLKQYYIFVVFTLKFNIQHIFK